MNRGSFVLATGFGNRIVITYPTELAEIIQADINDHIRRGEEWDPSNYEATTVFQDNCIQLFTVYTMAITGVTL